MNTVAHTASQPLGPTLRYVAGAPEFRVKSRELASMPQKQTSNTDRIYQERSRLGSDKLLPPKLFRSRARRCNEPVRRAISRTTCEAARKA